MQIDWYDVVEKAEKARYLVERKARIEDLRRSITDRQVQGDKSEVTIKLSLNPSFVSLDFDDIRLADMAVALGNFLAKLEEYYAKEYDRACENLRDAVC